MKPISRRREKNRDQLEHNYLFIIFNKNKKYENNQETQDQFLTPEQAFKF